MAIKLDSEEAKKAYEQIEKHLADAKASIDAACKVSDESGIPFHVNVIEFRNDYIPKKTQELLAGHEEDEVEGEYGKVDGRAIVLPNGDEVYVDYDYGYGGWQQSGC